MAENSHAKKHTVETGNKLVATLDELLANGDWEASLFLKTTKKRFIELRDKTKNLVEDLADEHGTLGRATAIETRLKPGHMQAYIFLYQTDGNNLQLWQKQLVSLEQHSLTRPVYKKEENIRELIRSKPEPQRLGYAIIAVKETDIIKQTNPMVDRFGHELLTLQEGTVKLDNILEFVHANKRHYIYKNHTLTLVSSES